MREVKNNNSKQQPKRKLRLSPKGKIVLFGVAASVLLSSVGMGVYAHKKEVVMDQAAEAYVNTMSRAELNMIAGGYSPARDEVISDLYENQRNEGYDLIREITGLEGLYDQDHSAVSLEDYQELADRYKTFVKDFAWDNVGQYYYNESERPYFCFYERFDKGDGSLDYCLALDQYNRTDNTFSDSLNVSESYAIDGSNKYLRALVENYVQVLSSNDMDSLRRALNRAPNIINNVTNQMYYIDDNGVVRELPVQDVQEHAIDEIQDGDFRIAQDNRGNTTVLLTDIHPNDDRDDR